MTGAEHLEGIRRLLAEYFAFAEQERASSTARIRIPLAVPTYGLDEILETLDVLVSAKVTMGDKVFEFERQFARYLGVEHAIMVNSGSSANLIALSVLANPVLGNRRIIVGDEIIVPAVAWSTTVFPVTQIGARPVLVDVKEDDYNLDMEQVERAVSKRTRAIMPVHLLGVPCEMDEIRNFAAKHGLFIIEDACEAHGAEYAGRKVGSFSDMGTFSFFFSHHISTIEGGMVVTDDEEYAELARTLRAHGWIRELKHGARESRSHSHIDPRFLFVNLGFNLRPTEIQGAFGIHQTPKLDTFIQIRRENARYWHQRLVQYSSVLHLPSQEEKDGSRRVWFGYPVGIRPEAPFVREELTAFLEERGIETRPIMAGNLAEQPALAMIDHRVVGDLPVAKAVMRRAFFWGNHHLVGEEKRAYVADCVEEFLVDRIAA